MTAKKPAPIAASTGHGSDTVKLKNCTACRLVKYCSVDCQRAHRKQHKKACKKRAAELKDEQLYSQGHERPGGEFCPICTLPIQLPMHEYSVFNLCCMKRICNGCAVTAQLKGLTDCAFCRTPLPEDDAEPLAQLMARVEKRDPEAFYYLGNKYRNGELGLQKDMRKAAELWTEGAELGSISAIFSLGNAYYNAEGVEVDKAKGVQFWTMAAMQGHAQSRYNLGWYEGEKGNYDRAVKHYLISSKLGDKVSLEMIRKMFMVGGATKEQFAQALQGYQDAVEETKSYDRDEVKRLEG